MPKILVVGYTECTLIYCNSEVCARLKGGAAEQGASGLCLSEVNVGDGFRQEPNSTTYMKYGIR